MVSAGCVQTLLTCAKAQERRTMLPDGFSVGYFRLGTRLTGHISYVPNNNIQDTCAEASTLRMRIPSYETVGGQL